MMQTTADTPLTVAPATPQSENPKRGPGRPKGSVRDRLFAREPKPEAPKRGPGKPSNLDKLEQSLSGYYISLGSMMMMMGLALGQPRMMSVGHAMEQNAENCAKSLAQWAETNPRVRKALEAMATAGGAGLVLAAHAPILQAAFSPQAADGAVGGFNITDLLGGFPAAGGSSFTANTTDL